MALDGMKSSWQVKPLAEQLALFPRVETRSKSDAKEVEQAKLAFDKVRAAAVKDLDVAEKFMACKSQGGNDKACGFVPGSQPLLAPSKEQNVGTLEVLKAFYHLEMGPAGRKDLQALEARIDQLQESNPSLSLTGYQVLRAVQMDIAANYIFEAGLVDLKDKVEKSTVLSESDKAAALAFIPSLRPVLERAYEPPTNLAKCAFKFSTQADLEACVAQYAKQLNDVKAEVKAASKNLTLSTAGKLQLLQFLKSGPAANLVFMMGLR